MIDRRVFLASATSVALVGAANPSSAAAPLTGRSGPSFHRFTLGSIEIVALSDGLVPIPSALTTNIERGRLAGLLAGEGRPDPSPTSVNTFVVNDGRRTVLIDTGAGGTMGAALGRLPGNLAAAGIKSEDIDVVALTHIHPDHSNGLLTGDGAAAFPNAEIAVGQADLDYWTDETNANRIAKDFAPFFGMAKAALAPYRNRIRGVTSGDLAGAVTAVPAPGHTPGHMALRISVGTAQVLVIGDAVHAQAVQFAHPEAAVAFDVDSAAAIASRRRLFDMAATDRIPVLGMHLDFPALGRIERRGSAYAYQPAPWQDKLG